jgi:hypothetical protein
MKIQIRKSPQARAFFATSCEDVEVPLLQLLLWVRTRWASLYQFLDRILVLQKVEVLFLRWHFTPPDVLRIRPSTVSYS